MKEITFISIDMIDASIQACADRFNAWYKEAILTSFDMDGLSFEERENMFKQMKYAISQEHVYKNMVEQGNDIKRQFIELLDEFNTLLKKFDDGAVPKRIHKDP